MPEVHVRSGEENGKHYAYANYQSHELAFVSGDTAEDAWKNLATALAEKLKSIYDSYIKRLNKE